MLAIIFEELHEISVSVLYGSSMPVVLHTGLDNQLRHTQIKDTRKTKITKDSDTFFKVEHNHAHVSKSIICFNEHIDPCKPINKHNYVSETPLFTSYLAAEHPKHNKLNIGNIQKVPVIFLIVIGRGATLAPA